MKDEIVKELKKILPKDVEINLTVPENDKFGHYSTNIAFGLAKNEGKNPNDIAESIAEKAEKTGQFLRVEAVGGFVNFWLKDEAFHRELGLVLKKGEKYGRNDNLKGEKTIIEYTDPNPFKEFHIGHLMSNSIGESISRLAQWSGAKVKRACYQGDVGLHVAKAIWGMMSPNNEMTRPVNGNTAERVKYMAGSYALGSVAYATSGKMGVAGERDVKKEIQEINKKIYERSDKEINELYDWGRKASLEYFETIYKKLGTKFDYYFFESESAVYGKKIVEEGLKKGIFEESGGAIVFKGEKKGLHTRVFINSEGIPTYEAKDLGFASIKYKKYPYDKSIIITGNEVKDYFRVVLAAMAEIFPKLAEKTTHLAHGMMRFAGGKMSSRTGNVITAEELIGQVKKVINEKGNEATDGIAVGAIKYAILKQAIGGNIIFDFEKSISTEGNSGPYLQYAFVRAKSVLEKAKEEKVKPSFKMPEEISELESKIVQFPEVIERAAGEYAPSHVATYLVDLARTYNSYYAKVKIVDSEDKHSPYRVALTNAFSQVMKNGLEVLGISVPEKM